MLDDFRESLVDVFFIVEGNDIFLLTALLKRTLSLMFLVVMVRF